MKRFLLSALLLFAICAGFSGTASATTCSVAGGGGAGSGDDCYWTGAISSAWATSGNWSDSPGSGGTPGASCACTPVSGANIHIGGSASNSNAALNMGGTRTFGDWDGGSYSGALTWGSTTQITNKVGAAIVFGPSQTFPGTDNGSVLSLAAGSGTTTLDGGNIPTSGTNPIVGLPSILVGAGVTVNLTGHAYNGGSRNTLTAIAAGASFNANGQVLTMGHLNAGNVATTRTLNCGTGTINITADDGGTIWDTRVGGGTLNLTCNAGTVVFNPTLKSGAALMGATDVYGAVQINNGTNLSANFLVNAGSPTYGSLLIGPWTNFNSAVTVTTTGAITANGTAAHPITQDYGAGARTYNAGGGLTCTYCTLAGITKGTGSAWSVTKSFDGGFNTGFSVGAISAGGGGIIQ